MTEDLARELEQIPVGTIPNDYAALKTLIQTLPAPLSPEIRSAIAGTTAVADPGGQGVTPLVGAQIGSESGASVGVVGELFYGNANLIENPLIEGPVMPTWLPIPAGSDNGILWAASWYAGYVNNGGATPDLSPLDIGLLYFRWNTDDNPFNSSVVGVDLPGSGSGAVDYTVYATGYPIWSPYADPALSYLTASAKIAPYGLGNQADCTKFRVRMEIVRGSSTVYAGEWFDMLAHSTSYSTFRITAAAPRPTDGWYSYSWRWRMRIDYARPTAASGDDHLYWGEPSLALSATQSPPPFSPIVGKWVPENLNSYDDAANMGVQIGNGVIKLLPSGNSNAARLRGIGSGWIGLDSTNGTDPGALSIGGGSGASEGAQIDLEGNGAAQDWHIDNYAGVLRMFGGSSVQLAVQDSVPEVIAYNNLRVDGGLATGGRWAAWPGNVTNWYARLCSGYLVNQWENNSISGKIHTRNEIYYVDLLVNSDSGANVQPQVNLKVKKLIGTGTVLYVVVTGVSPIRWELWAKQANAYVETIWYPTHFHAYGSGAVDPLNTHDYQSSLPSGTQYNETTW
jgi:hypothetical protein